MLTWSEHWCVMNIHCIAQGYMCKPASLHWGSNLTPRCVMMFVVLTHFEVGSACYPARRTSDFLAAVFLVFLRIVPVERALRKSDKIILYSILRKIQCCSMQAYISSLHRRKASAVFRWFLKRRNKDDIIQSLTAWQQRIRHARHANTPRRKIH